MAHDLPLLPARARAYVITGALVTICALALLLTGRTGMLSWSGLGLGLACLLVGAAQNSSLRHRSND